MISYGVINLWKLEQADLGDHYRWANNSNLRRLLGGPPQPRSYPDIEGWYRTLVTDRTREMFSIKTSDAQLVGWTQLFGIDSVAGSAEVAILIDEDHWGQGYGHDALAALLKYAFEDLRLHRIGAEILSINLPSVNLFQKMGFQKEGVKRESYFTSGRFLETDCFGLLVHEFLPNPPRSGRTDEQELSTEPH
jgi:RimJ/RimL family protein N-acetyltransferase